MTGFLVALAFGGLAWGAGPDSGRVAVAASTAAAVAVSSEASAGAPVEARPKAPRTRRSRVIVHKEAADWEPVSVVLQPGAGRRTAFERLVQGYPGGVYRGKTSPTKAAARAYRAKGDRWLVIALYPADLRSARTHLEARFRVQEGYLEDVKVAAVRLSAATQSYIAAFVAQDRLRSPLSTFCRIATDAPRTLIYLYNCILPAPRRSCALRLREI